MPSDSDRQRLARKLYGKIKFVNSFEDYKVKATFLFVLSILPLLPLLPTFFAVPLPYLCS